MTSTLGWSSTVAHTQSAVHESLTVPSACLPACLSADLSIDLASPVTSSLRPSCSRTVGPTTIITLKLSAPVSICLASLWICFTTLYVAYDLLPYNMASTRLAANDIILTLCAIALAQVEFELKCCCADGRELDSCMSCVA